MKKEESHNSPFSKSVLLQNYEGIEDLMLEVIDLFLSKIEGLLYDVKASIDKKDAKSLEISAHSLKGAVSNFYAEPSRLLAWELEKIGHSCSTEGTEEILSKLRSEIDLLCLALKELRKERESHG